MRWWQYNSWARWYMQRKGMTTKPGQSVAWAGLETTIIWRCCLTHLTKNHAHLVGGFNPSEKYESQYDYSQLNGKIKFMFQTTNQIGKSCLPQQLGTLGTTIGKSVHMKQAPQSHGFLAGMKSHFWWNCRFSTSGSHQIDSFWSVQCDWKPHGVLREKNTGPGSNCHSRFSCMCLQKLLWVKQ